MIRSQAQPPLDASVRACVLCQAPLEGAPRCAECGAAQRPGGFRPIRLLAQRPHSRVYLAEAEGGRQVILKELLFHLAPDAKAIDALDRECALLRDFRHPGVPRLLDVFSEGTGVHLRLYQVQEYVPGRSLQEVVEAGPLPEKEVQRITRQALHILDALHRHAPPIVHRDLKPSNLIRREDGTLALVDFGAARLLPTGETHGATLVGTFGYMPPEQLGGTVGPASDLYGLGATLLHLITGRPPTDFLHEGLELRFTRAVPPQWRPLLAGLLARNPAARFGSAREALAALEGKRARRRPWLIPGAAAGALAVLAALGFATHRAEPHRPGAADVQPPEVGAPADDPFAQLEAAQVDSARLSALYELLYSSRLEGAPLTPRQEALLQAQQKSPSAEIREKAAQILARAKAGGADGSQLDALIAQAQDGALPSRARQKAAAAAGALLARMPQTAATAAHADALVDLALTAQDLEVRAFAGSQLPRIHPLSAAALDRIREAYLEREGPQGQLLATLISHVADLHVSQEEALALIGSSNVHARHLGVVALTRFPLTPALRAPLERLAKDDPSDEVRDDARLVLQRGEP